MSENLIELVFFVLLPLLPCYVVYSKLEEKNLTHNKTVGFLFLFFCLVVFYININIGHLVAEYFDIKLYGVEYQ